MSKALEEKYGDSPANYMPGANTPGAKAGKKAGGECGRRRRLLASFLRTKGRWVRWIG
jgi:hypothetical protein